jgi:glutathione S-transferase
LIAQAGRYFLYSMQLSWYSAKVRPYLRYRRLPFDERTPTFREYNVEIKRRVGHAVVPVVITPEGKWLQDSSVILERLDQRFPAEAIIPATPRQRFASYLLELWADEFWLPAGVHARWSFPENYPKWRDELSAAFAPGWPRVLQRVFPLTLRQFMRRVNLQVGATPGQRPLIERWMDRQLDALERHFAVHPWVFGQRPSLADFSLAGPLCGHLCYDEASCERWIRPRPHLHAWSQRMWTGVPEAAGPFLADDAIPETLQPALESAVREMTPYLEGTAARIRGLTNGPGGQLPRFVGPVSFPYANSTLSRLGIPYTLWMAQRLLEVLRDMPVAEADVVRDWVTTLSGQRLLALELPRLKRVSVHAALA